MASYLITGTARGIGYELVNQLVARPTSQVKLIIATSRNINAALESLIAQDPDRIKFVKLEVGSFSSITQAAKEVTDIVGDDGLDVLINNAGVMPFAREGIHTMPEQQLNDAFQINVTGVQMVSSAFLPLLRQGKSKTIVNISTTVGSIALSPMFKHQPAPAYKITKAALNMLTVQWSQDFEEEGFCILCLSPGWLQTDLGSAAADLPVSQGTKATLDIIDRAVSDKTMTGKLYDIEIPGHEYYRGDVVSW